MLGTLLVPVAATSGVPGSGDASAHPIAATPNVGQVGVVPLSVIDSDPDPATDELGTALFSRLLAPRSSSYGSVGEPFLARPSGLDAFDVPERAPPFEAEKAAHVARKPKTPRPKLYDVRVAVDLKTSWIDGGCGEYCVPYDGTHKRSESYQTLRLTFKQFGGIVDVQAVRAGNSTTRWNHEAAPYCAHETPVVTSKAEFRLFARYRQARRTRSCR